MSQSIDVGTVLGGRYKVTSSIVASQEGDLVLDGVDQVLNRPVSILVSGPGNSDQLAQSAREVATGERPGVVQVLDLGVSHGSTYLIANHSSAADLLDLIVAQDAPYVEPHFTETLGSELFGESRSNEPETYDGFYDAGHPDQYIRYDEYGHPDDERGAGGGAGVAGAGRGRAPYPAPSAGSGQRGAGQAATGQAGPGQAGPGQAATGRPGAIPPPPPAPPRTSPNDAGRPTSGGQVSGAARPSANGAGPGPVGGAAAAAAGAAAGAGSGGGPAGSPKVSPWPDARADGTGSPVSSERGGAPAQPRTHLPPNRPAAVLPTAARPSRDDYDYEDYDDEETRPRSMPWLVGGVLAVVLIAALIFAFTTLGNLFQPQARNTSPAPAQTQASQSPAETSQPPTTETSAPPAGPPAVDTVTRLNPGELEFANAHDNRLSTVSDGNTATYWSDMEFASADWGGFVKSVSLLVTLEEEAPIKQVTLVQSGGSGGNVSIYTNGEPSLTGATLAGTTSFTGPQVTVPVANSPQAKYVIVQINALPRLSAPKTPFDFGLRLAEIKVE